MFCMNKYTTVYFDYELYHKHKRKIKANIMSKYGLVWNPGKVKFLNADKIKEMYDVFHVTYNNDMNSRDGKSGVWQNKFDVIKIVMFDKVDKNEHLPVLLIIKGDEVSQFYKELCDYCLNVVGCEIKKFTESESGEIDEVFSKKINTGLVKCLNDKKGRAEVIKKSFHMKVECLKNIGINFSDNFVDKWDGCIDKYETG